MLDYAALLAGWIAGQGEPADAIDAAACQALAPLQPALAGHLAESVGVSLGSRGQALRWAALCHDWGKPATRVRRDRLRRAARRELAFWATKT